ncbi:MAG: MFS transporter, partial [Thermomicrobiales bacterium]
VLAGAAVGFGAALFVVSVINHPATLLLGFALLRTFGSGTLTLTARTLIPQWFVRRRGFAFSLLGFGAALSLAAVPAASEALIGWVGWVGWRSAWRIDALVIWLVLVPAVILFVRDRPEDIGQFPDGRPPEPVRDGAIEPVAEVAWTPRQAARTRSFWYLLSAGVVPSLVVTGLSFNQVSIFTSRGMSSTLAATTFTVESAVALPVSLLCGWLVDRYPSRYVLAASQLSLAVAMIWLLVADTVWLAVLYAVFRGASSGLWNVAADVTWPAYFGRRYLGSIRSVTFAVGIAGAAIGPLPFGIVYDTLGSYDYAIAGLLVLPALSTLAAARAVPPRTSPVATVA